MLLPSQWLQTPAPLHHVTVPYVQTVGRWADASLPPWLLAGGPFGMSAWQWLALAPLAVIAWVLGWGVTRIVLAVAVGGTRRTAATWDDALVVHMRAPLTLGLAVVACAALLPALALEAGPTNALHAMLRVAFLVAVFWSLWRLVDIVRDGLATSAWARRAAASRSLLPLASRVGKIVILALGAVVVLSSLGYPVASVIAGLGIGGLAVALAAQKTVENLFGAFSLGVDQPFREGDFVKVEDFVGTVEAIGLRSTRIRTLDRTIITMPNGKLADMRLESFAARDRLRLATVIGLEYATSPAQMREVLAGFEQVLRAHPRLWPDALTVRFSAFAASSLDIEIMAWFETSDWAEFQAIRQGILLQFMDVVERAGTGFAFPTRTVHIVDPRSAA